MPIESEIKSCQLEFLNFYKKEFKISFFSGSLSVSSFKKKLSSKWILMSSTFHKHKLPNDYDLPLPASSKFCEIIFVSFSVILFPLSSPDIQIVSQVTGRQFALSIPAFCHPCTLPTLPIVALQKSIEFF